MRMRLLGVVGQRGPARRPAFHVYAFGQAVFGTNSLKYKISQGGFLCSHTTGENFSRS